MRVPEKLKPYIHAIIYGEIASAFFGIFQGRCSFFAIAFSIVGCYGWLVIGRDLTSFALFAGAIQALLLAHSYKEDLNSQKQQQQQTTQVINNIEIPPATPPSTPAA